MSYALLFTPDNGPAITCLDCGRTSYNKSDVEQLYCGHCKRFHQPPDGAREPLVLWVVTDHPTDVPDCFVARKQLIKPGGATEWTADVIARKTLSEVRAEMRARRLTAIPRSAQDDPVIVEVWL